MPTTFNGIDSFVHLQLSVSTYSFGRQLSLMFRTRRTSTLLFHLGSINQTDDFVQLSIQNGFLLLLVDFGTGKLQLTARF